MCCGQDETPAAPAVTTEGAMVKVYTAVPGAVLNIGGHGTASNEQAAEVPESVASELAGRADLVIVRPQATPEPASDFTFHADDPPAAPAKRASKAQKES